MLIYKVGRGLRLSPATGKKDCLIIDVVDRIQDSGLVATPALFGQDYVPDKTPVTPDREEPDTVEGGDYPDLGGNRIASTLRIAIDSAASADPKEEMGQHYHPYSGESQSSAKDKQR
jgi:hypothetical protein